MKLITRMLLCLCIGPLNVLAQEEFRPPLLPPDKQPINLEESNKKDWLANMRKSLPAKLCEKDQYFVQCFQTTPEECVSFTQVLVGACVDSATLAIPEKVDSLQGEYWGKMIGRCSYDLYEKYMASKKRDLAQCKESKGSKAKP